jgi:hypothetical protein
MSEVNVGMTENKSYPVLDPDTYVGRCYLLADLGTHTVEYKDEKTGKPKPKDVRKVWLGWEIPSKMNDVGNGKLEPSVIGREFSSTLGSDSKPSKLLETIQGWRGKPFTVDEKKKFTLNKLVGAPAMLSVVHAETRSTGRTYAKLNSVSKVPSGFPVPDPVLKPVTYSLSDGAGGAFNDVPKFLREKIMVSKEWVASFAQPPANTAAPQPDPATPPTEVDDVPF